MIRYCLRDVPGYGRCPRGASFVRSVPLGDASDALCEFHACEVFGACEFADCDRAAAVSFPPQMCRVGGVARVWWTDPTLMCDVHAPIYAARTAAATSAPYSGPTCGHLVGELECGEPATLELVTSDAVWSSAGRYACCDEHGTSEYLDTFRMGGITLVRLADGTEMSWVDVKALELGILAG